MKLVLIKIHGCWASLGWTAGILWPELDVGTEGKGKSPPYSRQNDKPPLRWPARAAALSRAYSVDLLQYCKHLLTQNPEGKLSPSPNVLQVLGFYEQDDWQENKRTWDFKFKNCTDPDLRPQPLQVDPLPGSTKFYLILTHRSRHFSST